MEAFGGIILKNRPKNMDLMSAICSSDYNQPNKKRSASLKVTLRTQSKSINKATQMAHIKRSSNWLQSHRFSDYINCCDNRILAGKRLRSDMWWEGILVFSLIVLINIASINCTATRQLEGESILSSSFNTLSRSNLYDFEL